MVSSRREAAVGYNTPMGSATDKKAAGLIARYAGRLRFPQLLVVTALLFLLDLFVPDFIPFVDEVLLGLATLLLATWKRRKDPSAPDAERVIDVKPDA